MKKINEVSNKALKRYAENSERIDEITSELLELNREFEKLDAINKTIEETGNLPVFNSDDIPF